MISQLTSDSISLYGEVTLTASKSESNRVLILQALCESAFTIHNLAEAEDTQTLKQLLGSPGSEMDVGPAGTTMRFMTAYLACGNANRLKESPYVLTGSDRMLQRPIRILVDALRILGAKIEYSGIEGYPPLVITPAKLKGGELMLDGSVSSQFVTALMLIGSVLKEGLKINFEGRIVSRSYVNMTMSIMGGFGIDVVWDGDSIQVKNTIIEPSDFTVEADWSAASYLYSLCALSGSSRIKINGLKQLSFQGDSVVAHIFTELGVSTVYNGHSITIEKSETVTDYFRYDFQDCPDLVQTVAVVVSALGIPSELSGLETLRIKETDRIRALNNELIKFGVVFTEIGDKGIRIEPGKFNPVDDIIIDTYDDHRMAMAFAPLCLLTKKLGIENAGVVKKSYPGFWTDLAGFGLTLQ